MNQMHFIVINLADALLKNIGNLNNIITHYKKALEYDNTSVNIYMHT